MNMVRHYSNYNDASTTSVTDGQAEIVVVHVTYITTSTTALVASLNAAAEAVQKLANDVLPLLDDLIEEKVERDHQPRPRFAQVDNQRPADADYRIGTALTSGLAPHWQRPPP